MGNRAEFYLAFLEVHPDDPGVQHPGVYVQTAGLITMIETLEGIDCDDPHVIAHFRELREALQRGVQRAITANEERRAREGADSDDDDAR